MVGKGCGGGLAAEPELGSARPGLSSRVAESALCARELSGEPGEDRVDQPFVLRESNLVFRGLGRLPETAATVELHGQEVTEQFRTARLGRTVEEVFEPRPIARAPGGLEPVAGRVDLAADLGPIEPVSSP
jgi:hypothetical protein